MSDRPPRAPVITTDALVLRGMPELLGAIGRAVDWVQEHLRLPVDPIPARWGAHGLTVRVDRLRLWCDRFPYPDAPHPDLPTIEGRTAIAKALGLSEPNLKLYMSKRAPWGRVPARRTAGRLWAYVDALQDWQDAQTMSLVVRDEILAMRWRDYALGAAPMPHAE